jgi:tRNA(Ile)-lysidine synthase
LDIQIIVKSFLQKYHDGSSPLLLALSGGSDSMALFRVLIELKIDFHVAHIDHGWREESKKEALLLEEIAKKNHIPFHTIRLENVPHKNKEEAARMERLAFYQSLTNKIPFQAVLLGHHQGDLAETVLKRVLEGARLQKLHGIEEVSSYKGLILWRPLLSLTKETLKNSLVSKNLPWFEDQTNSDTNYLRARMREEIFPFIEKSFGKNFLENLLYLSKRSSSLKETLDTKLCPMIDQKKGPFGSYYSLSSLEDLSSFEKEHFLSLLFEKQGLKVSRKLLEEILGWEPSKTTSKRFFLQKTLVIIDRQKIFFLKQFPLTFPGGITLKRGEKRILQKDLTIEIVTESSPPISWQDLWKGDSKVLIPEGIYELALLKKGEDKYLLKWWNKKKVPVFLRSLFPVIKKKGIVHADLLSGYTISDPILEERKIEKQVRL